MQQAIDYINKKIEKYSKVVSDMDIKYIWNEIKYTYHGWFDHWYANWKLTALEDMKDELQALWDGWIPVTERKPKKMQEVDFSDWKNVWLWYYDGFTNSVTHWRERPLPPTPKQ